MVLNILNKNDAPHLAIRFALQIIVNLFQNHNSFIYHSDNLDNVLNAVSKHVNHETVEVRSSAMKVIYNIAVKCLQVEGSEEV